MAAAGGLLHTVNGVLLELLCWLGELHANPKGGVLADYPWIRKWDGFMGSCASYVKEQLALARAENAPKNAIYKRDDGSWATTDDVADARTRFVLGLETSSPPK